MVPVLVAALLAAVAAHPADRPAGAVLDGCARPSSNAKLVRFGGGRLAGIVLGHGRTGVVLANQSDENLCGWLAFARAVAAQGLRVLAFDYGSGAPEQEVAAAARELRRLGASRTVLGGASEGAKAAILAAASRPQLATAVVALSPERSLRGTDVLRAARKLRVPTLFAVSAHDPYSAQDTPALAQAASRAPARLVTVPGDGHGVDLVRGASAATVAAAALDFLLPYGARRRPPSLATECGRAVAAGAPEATAVAFTAADGVQLHGIVLGRGETTVVLAHEYPDSLCGWFPYADKLARGGARVLLFDQRAKGTRLDLDVVAAVEKARDLGAGKVVAMGASLGGAATLVAAGRDCFDVSGVVSVSGETDLRTFGRGVPPLYAVPFERHITAPLLVVGSRDDPLVDEAAVDSLLARVPGTAKRAVLAEGAAHGWDLLQGESANAEVGDAVADFVGAAGAPVATGCG
jgi:pimeloyl-ACP methyl ester carboxylesterase